MKIEFSEQIFEIYSNVKFHENPFSGSQVVPCRLMDSMMNPIVAFCKFVNVPQKFWVIVWPSNLIY
jgi:hypothetical protein